MCLFVAVHILLHVKAPFFNVIWRSIYTSIYLYLYIYLYIVYIYKVNDKDELLAKEGQWVYRLRSLKQDGLNESDYFFGHNRGERGRK